MSSTTELINYLQLQAGDWNRNGEKGLLEILDQAQDILYKQGSQQSIAYLETTGLLPTITTVSGTFKYELTQAVTGLSSDIWRVDHILTRAQLYREYNLNELTQRRLVKIVRFNGFEYFKYFNVQTVDSIKDVAPILQFMTDPGDTDDTFRIFAYKKPVKMLSEAIQPTIPEHLHITCLLPAALKLVEGYQNGNIIESLGVIEEIYKPMCQDSMNKGDQGEFNSVKRHEE